MIVGAQISTFTNLHSYTQNTHHLSHNLLLCLKRILFLKSLASRSMPSSDNFYLKLHSQIFYPVSHSHITARPNCSCVLTKPETCLRKEAGRAVLPWRPPLQTAALTGTEHPRGLEIPEEAWTILKSHRVCGKLSWSAALTPPLTAQLHPSNTYGHGISQVIFCKPEGTAPSPNPRFAISKQHLLFFLSWAATWTPAIYEKEFSSKVWSDALQ